VCVFSVWKSISCPEVERTRSWKVVCDESSQEGVDSSEDENDGTHQDGKTGASGDQGRSISYHTSLCVSDRRKTSPHLRYVFNS